METNEFHVISNYIVLMAMDLAAIASVVKLINQPGNVVSSVLHGLLIFTIVIIDISSESIILVHHDIKLINAEKVIQKNLFSVARAMQMICTIGWISLLFYMIALSAAAGFRCQDYCWQCNVGEEINSTCGLFAPCKNTSLHCFSAGVCGVSASGSCSFSDNFTVVHWSPPKNGLDFQNRTECGSSETYSECIARNPSMTDCVLLALVLIDAIYATINIWFRSYLYPITIPEYVMFFAYLRLEDLHENERDQKILDAAGKMEFGMEWTMDKLPQMPDDSMFTDLDGDGINDNVAKGAEIDGTGKASDKLVVKLDKEGELKYNKL